MDIIMERFSLEIIVEPLLQWFQSHARVLPWREEPTPYRVWVSEIMLQQTRVEAVKPYFQRFVETLPTIEDLAKCDEETLLKLWEGLGYYNRVRNMQIAAQTVVEEYGGELPADYEKLRSLKGIGNYTAGAIASIAYQIPVPAVDGNVLRVISRVTADESDIMSLKVKTAMEGSLSKIIPKNRAGAFNQALMELGATVCVPNGMPHCEECPWKDFCLALKEDLIEKIPVKSKAKPRKIQEKTVFVIRFGEKVVLKKRPSKGLLAGLYEFPNVSGHMSEEEALEWAKDNGIIPLRIQPLESSKHIFSHVEWHMTGYVIRVDELEQQKKGLLFVDVEETKEKYPIPTAFSCYAKYLEMKLGSESVREAYDFSQEKNLYKK